MKKIAFYTLGCKVNQADTASMEGIFRQAGYEVVGFAETADVYLINTCVVTNTGQRKSRQIINRAVRNHPLSLVAVTGCYPQTAPEEVKAIAGVDVIIGNQQRGKIVELVERALKDKQDAVLDNVQQMSVDTKFEELGVGTETDKTRAFLKIQEGCNQYCTYCIIPYARGPLRSRSLASIKEETAKLVAAGYKEVVLIGIHLGCYGKELQKEGKNITLYDAVKAALSVDGVQRLRLGSLESVEVEPRLLDLMAEDNRLCRHLHLPLQSGCDEVLQAMHRPYDTKRFATLLQEIRNKVSDVAITTDIIVGFPGETEDNFNATLDFVSQCNFAKMHIFPYSKRKGTPASIMPNQVDDSVKNIRAARLAEIDEFMHQKLLQSMIGKEEEVLFEQPVDDTHMEGLCGPYLRVVVEGSSDLAGEICKVKIIGVQDDFLEGVLQ